MPWNWELPHWPEFTYNQEKLVQVEQRFLLACGSASALFTTRDQSDQHHFIVELLSSEGLSSAKIEGEILDRESLQSSIKRHFGLPSKNPKKTKKESAMAELLCSVYETFAHPLTHEMLWQWHALLFSEDSAFAGKYRTHEEPMQIVSSRYDAPRVFFEAPPSAQVKEEMTKFIDFVNRPALSIVAKAAIAHVYFESIHPFEDGNGRIGRALVEKILSQETRKPLLIALSRVLEKRKKEYYKALETCNRNLDASQFVDFFAECLLQAQEDSQRLLFFLMEKSRTLHALAGHINSRQEKVLLRLYREGPNGFTGGLSAENYVAITKTSRATATRDLNDLLDKGVLMKTGELRHTRYWLISVDKEWPPQRST